MGTRTSNVGRGAGRPGRRGLLAVALVAFALVAAGLTACTAAGGSNQKAVLGQVKRTVYGQQATDEAARIADGVAQPVLEFTVEDSPPSTFVNWIVPDDKAAAFTAAVHLPPGFSLAKVRILESDPAPRYWLSLNVYRVSGLTTGLRAEWSTYVDDGSGSPRFMIVRARAADGSLDPIGPLALPEPFQDTYGADGVIRTTMNRTEIQGSVPVLTTDNLFTSAIRLPAVADRHPVTPTREWVAANDFIYWLNGVNDRTFHNSTSYRAPLISVDLADVTLQDDTEWAPFVDPVPGHVLVYLDKLQFMIGPWWNVTAPDGRVDPATRASLLDLKKSIYGGLTQLQALSVLTGNAEPIVQSSVASTPQSTYWHWRIPDAGLAAFQAAAHVPAGLSLAKVRLQDDDAEAAHWLTLKVSRGSTAGLQAEWSTYVSDGKGTRTLVLEARTEAPSLDPVHVADITFPFTAPYPISHTTAGGTVSTTVGTGPTAFSSTFALPPAGPGNSVLASRDWVGTNDLRYWANGVADRVFADSRALDPKISVDPATVAVADGGPWAAFAGGTPDRVWVDQSGVDQVVNPWWNLAGL